MRLVWALIVMCLISIISIQESFSSETDGDYRILLTDRDGNTSGPEYLGDEKFIAFHSMTTYNNQGNPIEAKIRIECGPNNVLLYDQTTNFTISNPRTLIDSFTFSFSGVYTLTMVTKEIPPLSTKYSLEGNFDDHCDSESVKNLPPLRQISAGILYDNIICKEGLSLINKIGGSPACVFPDTKMKLIERGWASR